MNTFNNQSPFTLDPFSVNQPPCPCEQPERCSPERPLCLACIAGRDLFAEEGPSDSEWVSLSEATRESWRIYARTLNELAAAREAWQESPFE